VSQLTERTDCVCVVIAVWDSYASLVSDAVASALSQTGVEVEVVVVDNASVAPLPSFGDRARIVRAPVRLSAGAARNLGLGHANASFVLFLDADDTLLPGALARLVHLLRRDPRAVLAVGKHLLWSPTTGQELVVDRAPRPAVYRVARHPRTLALLTLRFDCYPLVGCAVIRTDAARDAGGFADDSLAEDWALRSALAFRGRVLFTPSTVVRVRVRDGSLWHRDHSRSELTAMFREFRRRRRADRRLPLWGRLALAPIALAQSLDARRLTAAGDFRPEDAGLIQSDHG
jgi:succinoglycan biosynthesis protein ExoO